MNDTLSTETAAGNAPVNHAQEMKFCVHCGKQIMKAAVICPHCGCQVEELKSAAAPASAPAPQIVITNTNTNTNSNVNSGYAAPAQRIRNKWTAFFLCLFFGYFGVHKFYEGRIGMGILYLLTGGIFGIGWLIDCIVLLCKPNPYMV